MAIHNKVNPKALAFWLFFICLLLGQEAIGQDKGVSKIKDKLRISDAVDLSGYLGGPLEASYQNRILAQDVDRLVEPFRHRTETRLWQGEFWGKWFTSAVLAYRNQPTPKLQATIDRAVSQLLATQTADGYIGNYREENRLEEWDIWGRKYVMLGLLAYHDITNEQKVLAAVQKVADHLIREVNARDGIVANKGNYKGMAASSVLEPITLLYKKTGDKKYLDFAETIVQQWETEVGAQLISKSAVPVARRFPFLLQENWLNQGQKSYEMMSCYEGLLELYRITGNPIYKTVVENTWKSIYDTEINILGSGSASECWYNGRKGQPHVVKHADETCVTVTWIKLSLQLLKLTGDVKYAHAVEQSYYNSLLGAMKPDGSTWAMYSPMSGIRDEGSNQCNMGLNCCVASGPRGLFAFPLSAVMSGENAININFFNEGNYSVRTGKGQSLTLKQTTSYPLEGNVRIQLQLPKEEFFTIYVRIPDWSKQSTLVVNGESVTSTESGSYAIISRTWKNNDVIALDLDMRGRLETMGDVPTYLAIFRGPLVLARDARLADGISLDETISPVISEDSTILISMKSADTGHGELISFGIPCYVGSWLFGKDAEPRELLFTNYASAGGTFSHESAYRIWFPKLIDPSRTGLITNGN